MSSETYDAVVTIEGGDHPLRAETGTHSAIVRVFHRVASSCVTGLDVLFDDAFAFDVHRPLTARRARPMLRGHVVNAAGNRISVGARARDDHERSFDLFAGVGREMVIVGSLRLGQRVAVAGETAAVRDGWTFGLSKAAA